MPDSDATRDNRLIDQLAAVVLHVLVSERARTFEAICRAVERDPKKPHERSEVDAALTGLVRDKLAAQEGEQWTPTRAAVRAAELSF
jgi:hypothetical protein